MMVVCPNHHHQCTVNALDIQTQHQAKANPFNIMRGFVDGQLLITSRVIAVEAGSNQFIGSGFKFVVDGESLLRIRPDTEGRLLLSLNLYGPDDSLLMMISENEWIAGDPLAWDLQFAYNLITLRRADRIVSLDIDARSPLVTMRGELWRKGQHFSLSRDMLMCNGVVKNVGFSNVGLIANFFVVDTSTGTFRLEIDPRLGGAISGIRDPNERLKDGIATFHRLCREAKLGRNELCPCESGRKLKHCHQSPRFQLD
jgi:hypothetical protein